MSDCAVMKQNLIDAGCDETFIERFMSLDMQEQKREALAMLAVQRRSLLEGIHSDEKKISCLDFLVNKIKK